jgi:hypothetical protein
MPQADALRPLERRMMQMAASGMDEREIAWRFRRSPRFVRQVLHLSRQPDRRAGDQRIEGGLRPLERRVLQLRDQGAAISDLAPRFRRTPRFLEQVEDLARYKLANG